VQNAGELTQLYSSLLVELSWNLREWIMRQRDSRICFDATKQRATVSGQVLKLQAKAMRVLSMIVARAPQAISRTELIATVWEGNHLLGERGLNQAMWAIRAELGDNAREPTFIRTHSREGFQWINSPAWHDGKQRRLALAATLAAGMGVLAIISVAPTVTGTGEYALPGQCEILEKNDVKAYKINRDVVVNIHDACQLIVKPSGTKRFGDPFVSSDGKHVAFVVREDQNCRLISVALRNGVRTDFETCSIEDGV
jgi:DNA-binding winged helix-turn-helix (wHTH) protein